MSVCMHVRMCLHMCMYIYIYIYLFIYSFVYLCVRVCICSWVGHRELLWHMRIISSHCTSKDWLKLGLRGNSTAGLESLWKDGGAEVLKPSTPPSRTPVPPDKDRTLKPSSPENFCIRGALPDIAPKRSTGLDWQDSSYLLLGRFSLNRHRFGRHRIQRFCAYIRFRITAKHHHPL